MAYLIAQIFVCLLLAALLGGLVGWLLRGRRTVAAPDADALTSAQRRIETLERELAACQDARPAAPIAAGTVGGGLAASAAGHVIRDAPAMPSAGLFGAPAATPIDDLETISGVGPVIATQLAGIGVTTFRQIASFTPDDVGRVTDAIGVAQGRIEREDWIAQAARLHTETYGTDA